MKALALAAAALALAACAAPPAPRAPAPAPSTAPAPAPPPAPTDALAVASDLIGAWTGERELSHGPSGPLRLQRAGAAWTAALAGITVTLAHDAKIGSDWLRSDLGSGELRIRIAPHSGGTATVGPPDTFWIQGGGVAHDAPYATPIALHAATDGSFAGDVVPLPDRLHITLVITAATAATTPPGALSAYVREPDFNYGGMVRALTVARRGADVDFIAADGKPAMHGTLGATGLHVTLAGADAALDLQRAPITTTTAAAAEPAPTLDPPPAGDDGWPVATLADVGMHAAPLAELLRVAAAPPTDWSSPAVQAILIARHGKLVVERYQDGFTADTPHDTRSAGKSWSSTLAGIAVDRGELALTTRLAPRDPDPRKSQITLEHLLTMSSGLACDDDDDASPGNETTMQSQHAQPDWHRYMLALPMIRAPGERAVYCSGAINLVGALLAPRETEWLPARWVRDLAVPLQLSHYYLNLMPNEQGYLAGGTYMRPRDFAKLAQVILDRGTWRGKRVVSAAWVDRAIAAHATIHHPDDYGFAWWRTTYHVAGHDYPAVYASGNGGQLAIAIPSLDLAVIIMAGNYSNFATWRRFVEDWVPAYVIPAATEP